MENEHSRNDNVVLVHDGFKGWKEKGIVGIIELEWRILGLHPEGRGKNAVGIYTMGGTKTSHTVQRCG